MPIIEAPSETPLVIDTDIFSHLRNKQSYVLTAIKSYFSITKQFPALTSMTIFEAHHGIEREITKSKITNDKANDYRQRINELIKIHPVLPFDSRAAETAAFILPRLTRAERDKHFQDVFIISTVLSHNFGFATQNRKDAELIAMHLPENQSLRLAVWKP